MQIPKSVLNNVARHATLLLLSKDPKTRKGASCILQSLANEGVPLAAINMGFFHWVDYEKTKNDKIKQLAIQTLMKAPKQEVIDWLVGVAYDTKTLVEFLRNQDW